MYVYVYVYVTYMYACMHVYGTRMHICIYVYIYAYIQTRIYTSIYIYVYIYTYILIHCLIHLFRWHPRKQLLLERPTWAPQRDAAGCTASGQKILPRSSLAAGPQARLHDICRCLSCSGSPPFFSGRCATLIYTHTYIYIHIFVYTYI